MVAMDNTWALRAFVAMATTWALHADYTAAMGTTWLLWLLWLLHGTATCRVAPAPQR